MRILLVCSQHWSKFDSYLLDDDAPLTAWQAQFFFWRALKKLGHDVHVFRYTDPTGATRYANRFHTLSERFGFPWNRVYLRAFDHDRSERNKRLCEQVDALSPEVVLVAGGTKLVLPDTIDYIRKKGSMRSALLFMDSPLIAASAEEKVAAGSYDLIAASDKYHAVQWKELMARNAIALPVSGCDPDYHREMPVSDGETITYQSDLCFVGGLIPDKLYRERVKMLESISDLPLSIWTNDKDFVLANPILAPHYRGSAHGLEMVKVISASKIALNNHGCTIQNGGNMRTFEVASIGTFQLIDRYDSNWFNEGKEIVSYSSLEDLRQKISYFLGHQDEREAIAKAGQQRARREHTYEERMRVVLEVLAGLN